MKNDNKYSPIAHINFSPSLGVFNKLVGQARAAKVNNLPIDFYVITDQNSFVNDHLKIKYFEWPKNFFIKKIKKNFFHFNVLARSFDLEPYKRIVLRYPTSIDLDYREFLNKWGGRFLTEHHANVIRELRILEKGILNPVRIFLEKRNAPKILKHTCGLIGVTEEIRRIYEETSGGGIPSTVISNGIDVKSIPFSGYLPFDESKIHLLYVSNTFYPGHGLDLLLRGLLEYNGNCTIQVSLVGGIYRKEEIELIEQLKRTKIRLILYKQLRGENLEQIFRSAHIAVSALAAFRDGLRQACPLKTREYIARGIPFVYAYEDTDLVDQLDFCLRLPPQDSPVDITEIISFLEKVSGTAGTSKQMRDYAEKNLDWKEKLEQMVKFVHSTL